MTVLRLAQLVSEVWVVKQVRSCCVWHTFDYQHSRPPKRSSASSYVLHVTVVLVTVSAGLCSLHTTLLW